MIRHALFALVPLLVLPRPGIALELPLHPDDADVVRTIVETERLEVRTAEMPAWAKNGVIRSLAGYGVETKAAQAVGIAAKDRPAQFLGCVYDENGRVLALCGNGPWLRNGSLRELSEVLQAARTPQVLIGGRPVDARTRPGRRTPATNGGGLRCSTGRSSAAGDRGRTDPERQCSRPKQRSGLARPNRRGLGRWRWSA